MTIALITNLKAMPYKAERIAAASLMLTVLITPQYFLHGFDYMDWFLKIGMVLWYIYLPLAIDHDMIDNRGMSNIWVAPLITGLFMLPISFAQQYTVGFHVVASLAFVVSTILIEGWCNIQANRKILFELNPKVSLYEYEDTKYGVLGLVVLGGILSAVSGMEPMIVASFSLGTLIFIAVETVKINDVFKSYINSEHNRIERERQEADKKAWEETFRIDEEDYRD